MKDFYYILGTSSNATSAEIEAAYQKLARKLLANEDQPDDFINDHFGQITEAYDILRDSRRRSKYDAAVKKNQSRQIAVFKLKYLNIAATAAFLVIVALFGAYITRAIKGRITEKTVPSRPAEQSPAPGAPKKHHKAVPHMFARPLLPADSTKRQELRRIARSATQPPANDSSAVAILHANITGIVYLHRSPDYNSAVVAKIPDAAKVQILEKGLIYDKISFDAQTGYVLKSAVADH